MIAAERTGETESSRGFALLAVLWFLVLIAAIGTYLMANARSETAIARNILAAARAEALAGAGIAQAAFHLSGTLASDRWKPDGTWYRVVLPAGEVRIRLHDETGKINPNRVSAALMSALFEAAGLDRFAARRLGAAVAVWVRPAAEARQIIATKEQYRDAGKNYAPPNAPIESIDELQLVLGMTPRILASVRPYLTIHTQAGQPDRNYASPLVRQAIDLARLQSRASAEGAVTPANSSAAVAAGNPAETIFEIEAKALTVDGGIFVRHAVLKIDPSSPRGYAVLEWRRGDLDD
jgi:general secretion pathway protein K